MQANKHIAFLALFSGLLFGIFTLMICCFIIPGDAMLISLFSGCSFSLLLYLYLIFYRNCLNKKYDKAEKDILSPVFYKTNGNFNLGRKVRNGIF